MPVEKLIKSNDRIWALWKITESETELLNKLDGIDRLSPTVTNPNKRLEFLASRTLLMELLGNWHLQYRGLTKDEAGKPFLIDHSIHISLSHSYPFVAAILDRTKTVGIDLEQPKSKLLTIAKRVLNPVEFNDAENNPVKHCVYWCAKETLIKIYGKRHLTLATELAIEPFTLQKTGFLVGRLLADGKEETYQLHYQVYDNFVVVLNH